MTFLGKVAVSAIAIAFTVASDETLSQRRLPNTQWADYAAMDRGDILVNVVGQGEFEGRVQAAVLIDADREHIWSVMTDCPSAPEFIPGVLSCERIGGRDGSNREVFKQDVKYSWYIPKLTYTFELDYFPYRQIDFRRLKGRPKVLEGSWWLEQTPQGQTRVFYSLYLEPGFLVPKPLVRRALRKDLPKVLAALRQRVEDG